MIEPAVAVNRVNSSSCFPGLKTNSRISENFAFCSDFLIHEYLVSFGFYPKSVAKIKLQELYLKLQT